MTLIRIARIAIASLGAAALIAGCGSAGGPSPGPGSARFRVVAGENFWGSIASQLAGDRASVQSIISNPDTDPHSYQPSAQDARTLAGASLAIVNGIGYDDWMAQLLSASPASGRVTLTVGDLLGLKAGDNPHQWYSPTSVVKVVNQIVADYDRLDPSDAAYFAARRRAFLGPGLASYDRLLAEIRARFAGVPVGYSESIFQPLGLALGLKLLTPYSFTKAIAEGTDVTAQDKQTVDSQAQRRLIRIWVYNRQNVTPDVAAVNAIVAAAQIPVVAVTETLAPASDSFEQWQDAELEALLEALHQATGR